MLYCLFVLLYFLSIFLCNFFTFCLLTNLFSRIDFQSTFWRVVFTCCLPIYYCSVFFFLVLSFFGFFIPLFILILSAFSFFLLSCSLPPLLLLNAKTKERKTQRNSVIYLNLNQNYFHLLKGIYFCICSRFYEVEKSSKKNGTFLLVILFQSCGKNENEWNEKLIFFFKFTDLYRIFEIFVL